MPAVVPALCRIQLAVVRADGYGEGFFGLGADAEVGVGFGEEDFSVLRDDRFYRDRVFVVSRDFCQADQDDIRSAAGLLRWRSGTSENCRTALWIDFQYG